MDKEDIEEAIEVLEDASAEMLAETGDENYYSEAIAILRQALEKEWVGLTDKEHDSIKHNYHNMTWTLEMFAKAIEQALKEKNT